MKEPKIRFNEFKGEWKEVTLGEIAPLIGGYAFQSANFEKTGIPIVRISNILDSGIVGGDFAKYKCFEGDILFRLYDGDTVIAMSGATTGKVAVVKTQTFLYQNQRVGKFSRTDKIYYPFVSIFVSSKKFTKELNKKLTASAQPNASSKDIDSVRLSFPSSKDEQQKIASFFTTLDAQISASTSRLASLKQIKAASLQAMFPQEGETVPKLRFKGFEGEWEKVAIKDIATFSKGRGYSKSDLRVVGTPIILYGRMYTKYEACITNVDTFVNPLPNSIYSLGNEVIMPASGETPEDISCASAIQVRGIILGGDLNVLHFNIDCYDTTFIALSLSIGKIKKDLSNMAQGKSVVHLHNSDIEKIDMFIPSFAEQRAIASFFTNLDRQITLQSQRLEKLKQIKAACLDKMFV